MTELEQYYYNFKNCPQDLDLPADVCRCRGTGWLLSDVDTWHVCRAHNVGQRHPDDYREYDDDEGSLEAAPRAPEPAPAPQEDDDIPF